ncbi:C4b-binding protein alpha chain isoform X1 [Dasypus novemcinctus]|uniref:C4b-binding protein alpha chain isoform X1 n=2 Tax=Dasypus novemcinctus TaxID=9361 RepID=UPI00265E4FEF|nr:C4b-binding protein alpha chain isoform X1 [Dasypus novemcinctus]
MWSKGTAGPRQISANRGGLTNVYMCKEQRRHIAKGKMLKKLQDRQSPRAPNGNPHRKGQMAAWPFSRLWKFCDPTLFYMTLVTSLLATVHGDCGVPPNLPFASPIKLLSETDFKEGTALEYTCRPGYSRIRSNPSLTCQKDGSWKYSEFCKRKQCSNPGDLLNGQVEIKTDYSFGSKIEFSCSEGYILIGSTTSYCEIQDKGVGWSDSPPVCVIVKCLPPPNIENGKHNGGNEDIYKYGSSVTYTCDPQFSLIGKASIFCTVENKTIGAWSPNPPTCEKIMCPRPNVPNATIVSGFGPTYNYKDSVVFGCKKGFLLRGSSSSVRCGVDKNWHPSLPSCELNGCFGLPHIRNASWEIFGTYGLKNEEVYAIGTQLRYRCNTGFRSTAHRSTTVTCQKDLTWTPFAGCEEMCCLAPDLSHAENIQHTRASFTNRCLYFYGDHLSYSCYEKVVDTRCTGDGRWHPQVPKCDPGCQTPPKIDHGHYKKAFSLLSTEYNYECDSGYTLVGEEKISCSNSVWSPAAPQCKALCRAPEIANGKLSVHKIHYIEPETVTVQCNTGYGVVGSERITCLENRTWYPEVPKCEWKTPAGCEQVLAGKHLMQCLPSSQDVKLALEVYKLSLEIELLQLERNKASKSIMERSFPKKEEKKDLSSIQYGKLKFCNLTAPLSP